MAVKVNLSVLQIRTTIMMRKRDSHKRKIDTLGP